MGAPDPPPSQQGDSSVQQDHPSAFASPVKHLLSSTRPHRPHSSSSSAGRRMKLRQASPTSSSWPFPPSSSSLSSNSLAPTSINFKRSRLRHPSGSPALFALQSEVLEEQVDSCQTSVTDVKAATLDPCLYEDAAQLMRTVHMHHEDAWRHADVNREERIRRAQMRLTACAMAHAYIHRHDVHQHGLHQPEPHQHDFYELSQQQGGHKDGSLQEEGLWKLQNALPINGVPRLASRFPIESSCIDKLSSSPMGLLNDAVCIDEVVNPTQAAEWFGALFLSNSTLVS